MEIVIIQFDRITQKICEERADFIIIYKVLGLICQPAAQNTNGVSISNAVPIYVSIFIAFLKECFWSLLQKL